MVNPVIFQFWYKNHSEIVDCNTFSYCRLDKNHFTLMSTNLAADSHFSANVSQPRRNLLALQRYCNQIEPFFKALQWSSLFKSGINEPILLKCERPLGILDLITLFALQCASQTHSGPQRDLRFKSFSSLNNKDTIFFI